VFDAATDYSTGFVRDRAKRAWRRIRGVAVGALRAMTRIILHHYATSPYSEKVRAILGYKRMAWSSVLVPPVMPKPDVVALTGGYRRTPVMQIGCDVYCDSKLMARVIDRLQPQPALVPAGMEATCRMIDEWSENVLFFLVVPLAMQPAGMQHFFGKLPASAIEVFQKDRQALFAGGSGRRGSMGATRNQLPSTLRALDTQLGAMPYVTGAAPTLADFCVFHPMWFVFSNPGIAAFLDPYPNLLAWTRRIAAFGHGEFERMTSAQALDVARAAQLLLPADPPWPDPAGIAIGDRVRVNAVDYGTEVTEGTLAFSGLDEVALERQDERAGRVIVHFPRSGYRIDKA
jgi:glutathione S-transferase